MDELSKKLSELTPEKLSALGNRLKNISAPAHVSSNTIQAGDMLENIPLSFAQQRIFFFHRMEHNSKMFNTVRLFEITGSIDNKKLEKCFNEIIKRHEIFRTTFVPEENEYYQTINSPFSCSIKYEDLSSHNSLYTETKISETIKKSSRKSFDLSSLPLFRINLIKKEKDLYLLIFTVHHIIFDGWSESLLIKELAGIYNAQKDKDGIYLPELSIQYKDYSNWITRKYDDEKSDLHYQYWKTKLQSPISVTSITPDKIRIENVEKNAGNFHFVIPPRLADGAKNTANNNNTTLYTIFTTVFKVLLYRYTNQKDIVLGTLVANRELYELQNLIGIFINTVILRTDLSGEPTFSELLTKVKQTTTEAFEHQEYPYEKLVYNLRESNSAADANLFNILFTYRNFSDMEVNLDGFKIKSLSSESEILMFDLWMEMRESPEGISCVIQYDASAYYNDTVERLSNHFLNLLDAVIKNPNSKISELSMLGDTERTKILYKWNADNFIPVKNKFVFQRIEHCAAQYPHNIAVTFGMQNICYKELNERSNRLAHYLRKRGIAGGIPVGLCMERSIDLVICLIGIMKAGGVFLPLDHQLPKERLKLILDETSAPIILTHEYLINYLPDSNAEIILFDEEHDDIAKEDSENPPINIVSDNLAYILYTSGSTGMPKGVQISHFNIYNHLLRADIYIGKTQFHKGTTLSTFTFDVFFWELFLLLCTGGNAHLLTPAIFTNAEALIDYLVKNNITYAFIPPMILTDFAKELERREKDLQLELISTGLEPISQSVCQSIKNLYPGIRIINEYGPTETTIYATSFEFTKPHERATRLPIGKSLPGYQVYIVDENLNPLPVGVPGEILVGGIGISKGYLNSPDLTDEKFIPDIFNRESKNRLYKTGDLAKYLPDGNIEFIGRIDSQVKIRGIRIELGEIESVILKFSSVRETVVVVKKDNNGEKRIVAYIVPHTGNNISIAELKEFLLQKLPEYMIPTAIMQIEKIPVTSNQKINYSELPVPDFQSISQNKTHEAPTTRIEKILTDLLKDVLKKDDIGITDNYFELGGNSLTAVSFFTRIEYILGKRFPLSILFKSPTIKELASVIEKEIKFSCDTYIIPMQPNGHKTPLFLIPAAASSSLTYYNLVKYLDIDRPIYGIDPVGLFDDKTPHSRVEDMAKFYIDEIKKVQPKGPYFIGGKCFGTYPALEVAQQLKKKGEKVEQLIILDHEGPRPAPKWLYFMKKFFKYLRSGEVETAFRRRLTKIKNTQAVIDPESKIISTRTKLVKQHHMIARDNYYAKRYRGNTVLFESEEFYSKHSYKHSWMKIIKQGFTHTILSNAMHEQLFLSDKYIKLLAEKINTLLSKYD